MRQIQVPVVQEAINFLAPFTLDSILEDELDYNWFQIGFGRASPTHYYFLPRLHYTTQLGQNSGRNEQLPLKKCPCRFHYTIASARVLNEDPRPPTQPPPLLITRVQHKNGLLARNLESQHSV